MKNVNTNNEKLLIIPLGGVEEIGINCTLIQYRDQIVVIDAGLGFSDVDHLGVDYLIPNYDYLQKNKDKIEAIFITHGHLDHIGAVAHFLEALDFPDLFASKFAMELIKGRLEEAGKLKRAKLNVVDGNSKLKSGDITVEYIKMNHSIPESMAILVRTPLGNIVHSGDFKFDNSPLNEPSADYLKLAQLGNEGVKVLLSDSTNAFRPGHSISEADIMGKLDDVVAGSTGRVIVGTFASLVTRLYALVGIAKRRNRKIFITGRSMQNSIDIARRLNYIDAPNDLFIDNRSVHRYADSKVMVLATGSQGENMAALSRMARGEHRDIKIKKGDTVMLSSSIIPGNDQLVQKLIDEISRLGAKVFHQSIMNLHTSGHGFIEDQKLMLSLTKPELFMPVHGYQYFLSRHGQTAVQTGVLEKNVIQARRGEVVEIGKKDWKIAGRVKSDPLLISGSGVGDVGPLVLQEREQLAKGGVISINLLVRKLRDSYELVSDPLITTKGFVYVRTNQEILEKISREVKAEFGKNKYWKDQFVSKLKFELEKHLQRVIYNMTEREPAIIVQVQMLRSPQGKKPGQKPTQRPAKNTRQQNTSSSGVVKPANIKPVETPNQTPQG